MNYRYPPDRILLEIEQLHPLGYGTGTAGDRPVAVFGALPGERVEARPIRKRRGVVYGRAEKLLSRAADRIDPICAHGDRCAGCAFQHVGRAAQLEFKEAQLRAELGDLVPGEWLPAVTGPTEGYRSKARLGVKYVAKMARVLIGFREKMSNHIAEIDHCPVLVEGIGRLLPGLCEVVTGMQARSAIPQIEVAAGDAEAALVVRHLEALGDADLALLRAFGDEMGVRIYLQPKGPESVRMIVPGGGSELLRFALPDYALEIAFHPLDFTQVNLETNRAMIRQAMGLLDPAPTDHVVDLFSGIGNLTLPLATRAGSVTGLEATERSVERARHNAAANGVENVRFDCADLYSPDGVSAMTEGGWNKVLIDPPRSGAEAVCRALARLSPDKVLYISCNPVTLARDSRILVTNGYELATAGIVDMFPHTTHVESMALFVRR